MANPPLSWTPEFISALARWFKFLNIFVLIISLCSHSDCLYRRLLGKYYCSCFAVQDIGQYLRIGPRQHQG